jgi:hypothetical protein
VLATWQANSSDVSSIPCAVSYGVRDLISAVNLNILLRKYPQGNLGFNSLGFLNVKIFLILRILGLLCYISILLIVDSLIKFKC